MKRILLFTIALVLIASQCFAWGGNSDQGTPSRWKTFVVRNSDTALSQVTAISTGIIAPNKNVILGYDIMKYNMALGAEQWVAVYDGGLSTYDEILGEAEKETANVPSPVWFPRPRTLEKQLYVNQGPNTMVIIYFE